MFKQRPSYGNFANLAEEFEARAKSRGQTKAFNAVSEEGKPPDGEPQSLDFNVGDKSLHEQIDPAGTSEWSYGTADNANRTGDHISSALEEEEENAERSRAGKFRGAVNKNSEDLADKAKEGASNLDSIFGPRPSGQAETRTNSGPQVADSHHSGVDPGSTVSALLAAGIVGAELFHRVKTKIRGER